MDCKCEAPEVPTEPEEPTDPSEPIEPSEPENPTDPSEPENPTDPSEPENPTTPSDPENPAEPKPVAPAPGNGSGEKEHQHVKTYYRMGYVWCYCGYQMNEVLKVKDENGTEIDWSETVERGVVTITLDMDNADFETWQEGLADLELVGIHTVILITNGAETELNVSDLLAQCAEGDILCLTHRGSDTKLVKTLEISLD